MGTSERDLPKEFAVLRMLMLYDFSHDVYDIQPRIALLIYLTLHILSLVMLIASSLTDLLCINYYNN